MTPEPRRLLPAPGRGADPGTRPLARRRPRRSRGSASRAKRSTGADFVALMEGRHPRTGAWLRRGRRQRRARRRDRPDVQRAEVGVGGVGARGRARRDGAIEAAHAAAVRRAIAHLLARPCRPSAAAASGQVIEERAARPGRGRVPAHHRARRAGGRCRLTRSCTATSSSPARSARTGGSSRSPRGRCSAPPGSSAPTTARRSRTSSRSAATRSERGPAGTAATSRSPASPTRSLDAFSARSREVAAGRRALPGEVGPRARARRAAQRSSSRTAGPSARHRGDLQRALAAASRETHAYARPGVRTRAPRQPGRPVVLSRIACGGSA